MVATRPDLPPPPAPPRQQITARIRLELASTEADLAWMRTQLRQLAPERVDVVLTKFQELLSGDLLKLAEGPDRATRDAGDLVLRFRFDGLRECFAAAVRTAQVDLDGFHGVPR